MFTVFGKVRTFGYDQSLWLGGLIGKSFMLAVIYILMMMLFEGRSLRKEITYLWAQFRSRGDAAPVSVDPSCEKE